MFELQADVIGHENVSVPRQGMTKCTLMRATETPRPNGFYTAFRASTAAGQDVLVIDYKDGVLTLAGLIESGKLVLFAPQFVSGLSETV